jgi:hypothetical protein
MSKLIKFESQKKIKADGMKIKKFEESVDEEPAWLRGRK